VEKLFRKKQVAWLEKNGEDPHVIEVINEQENLYIIYYDVKDPHFHPEDEGDYPYQRQGYVQTGKAAFSFVMFFKDDGRPDADKAISLFEHMKLMPATAEPVVSISAPR
jgi:hypothetical protein